MAKLINSRDVTMHSYKLLLIVFHQIHMILESISNKH